MIDNDENAPASALVLRQESGATGWLSAGRASGARPRAAGARRSAGPRSGGPRSPQPVVPLGRNVPVGAFHFRRAAPVTDGDLELCRRLIAAYDAAVAAAHHRGGMWLDAIFTDRQRALAAALDSKDPARLALTMATMFRSDFVLGLAPGSMVRRSRAPRSAPRVDTHPQQTDCARRGSRRRPARESRTGERRTGSAAGRRAARRADRGASRPLT
jgi:hypothetical protein